MCRLPHEWPNIVCRLLETGTGSRYPTQLYLNVVVLYIGSLEVFGFCQKHVVDILKFLSKSGWHPRVLTVATDEPISRKVVRALSGLHLDRLISLSLNLQQNVSDATVHVMLQCTSLKMFASSTPTHLPSIVPCWPNLISCVLYVLIFLTICQLLLSV